MDLDRYQMVLLGAEGLAELQGEPWLRDATPAEWSETITPGLRDWLTDRTGRPYFLVVVDRKEAPTDVVVWVDYQIGKLPGPRCVLRCKRLGEPTIAKTNDREVTYVR